MSSSPSSFLTLAFASLAHSLSHMFVLFYATVVLVLERQWGLSYAELMALSVPGAVLYGFCALPAGWLADKWSGSAMLAIFFVGSGAASVLTGFASGPVTIGLGLTLIGVFASIYHPVGIPWLIRHSRNHGRALGINGVFGSIGTAAAAVVAGILADLFGWRAAFILPGIASMIVGALFVLAIRQGRIVEREGEAQPQAEQSAHDRRRVFAILALTVMSTGLIYQALSYALPKFFAERLTIEESLLGIGGLVSLCYGISALAQIAGGELADRYSKKWVYVFGLASQVPLAAAAYLLSGPALVVAAALLVSFNVVGAPSENALLARFTPLAWRGRVYGVKFVLTLGVSAIGVGMIPVIHATLGNLDGLLILLTAFATMAAVAAIFIPSGKDLARERGLAAAGDD